MGGKELETFSMMALESLADEPDGVLNTMANPKLGIVTQCRFLPTIAEMREFCRNERIRIAEEDRRDAVATARRLPPSRTEVEPEVRTKIAFGLKSLVNEIRETSGDARQAAGLSAVEAKEAATEWLAHEQARVDAGLAPSLRLSPAAVKSLNKEF